MQVHPPAGGDSVPGFRHQSWQTIGVVSEPPVQEKHGWTPEQSDKQPFGILVPQSHSVGKMQSPSPQIDLHILKLNCDPVQAYPVSIVQVDEHPSPLIILSSSHYSLIKI